MDQKYRETKINRQFMFIYLIKLIKLHFLKFIDYFTFTYIIQYFGLLYLFFLSGEFPEACIGF
jgi:hypothetical protein